MSEKVKVAIVGVGNCATSLIEGVEFYRNAAADADIPGLMHTQFGPYHVGDVEFVAAFDVDADKVGKDLAEATRSSRNCTISITDVPNLGVTVQRGPTLDGLGRYYQESIAESEAPLADVPSWQPPPHPLTPRDLPQEDTAPPSPPAAEPSPSTAAPAPAPAALEQFAMDDEDAFDLDLNP